MRAELLGTGGYHPNERRHTSCIMLAECGVVFDAGTAFFRVPQRLQGETLQVFLSHSHIDHIVGLTFPLVAMMSGRLKRVRVYGSERTITGVRRHLFSDEMFPVQPDFEYIELPERIAVDGDGVLTHCPLEHPGESTGFRIDWPHRSLAFITDTIASQDAPYAEFIRRVDVLIHECNFPDSMSDWAFKTGHSHTTAVAELAREADVGRLVLTHIDPQRTDDDPVGLETARAIFPRTTVAEDLHVVEI